jgi:FRG domain
MQAPQPNGEYANWEWYFLMQHHGVPTRLLDWTDGSLVGLYFGISKRFDDEKKDAAVYVLDPYWLNDLAFKDMRLGSNRPIGVAFPSESWSDIEAYLPKDPFNRERLRPDLPLAITPNHLSSRFAAQKSQFTIYGHNCGDRLLKLAEEKDSGIRVIPVAGKSIQAIRTELAKCGVSESSVYPDLDGLGRELCTEWETRCCSKKD